VVACDDPWFLFGVDRPSFVVRSYPKLSGTAEFDLILIVPALSLAKGIPVLLSKLVFFFICKPVSEPDLDLRRVRLGEPGRQLGEPIPGDELLSSLSQLAFLISS